MTSQINTTNLNASFPIPGRDNDSQGFRTNFSVIKSGLEQAQSEISLLQSEKADLVNPTFFSDTTPATSTGTGALRVAGGVGIGGDVWVTGDVYSKGATSLTTASTITSEGSDVLISGTYGQQVLTLAPSIPGHKSIIGTLSVGIANPSTSTFITYAGTTAVDQTALRLKGRHNGTTALQLDTHQEAGDGSGDDFAFIDFLRSPASLSGASQSIGKLAVNTDDPQNIYVQYTSKMRFQEGAILYGTPAQTDPGIPGQMYADGNYIYVCLSTGAWRRIATPGW